ncbi:MAG: rhodanese-like domain-containing protein [Hellea sp.]
MMRKVTTSPRRLMASLSIVSIGLGQLSCAPSNANDAIAPVAASTNTQAASEFQVNYVTALGAHALLAEKPESVVLDIRTPKEVAKGHIEGAVFADFYADDFAERLTRLDKETHYVVHCGSGGRSTKALSTLEELGFINITHMDGGLRDWNKANLPLTQP